MLQPKYTMAGLEVKDQMSANGSLHSRVLRVVLTSHMSTLRPMLQKVIADVMRDEITSGQMLADDWTSVHSFSMAKNVIRTTNSSVFFGSELSEDPKFLEAAMQYPEDLLFASEVVRLTPSFLKSTTGRIVTRQGRAANTLVKYLAPIVEQRLMNQTSQSSQPKQLDCIQWLIDTNSRKTPWSVEKIIQVLLGLWFASVHQLAISIVYGLVDLCDHPEYIKALRDETKDYFLMNRGEVDLNNMPFLDSFLKESARLHPSDSISIRRKVLRPFTFHDGVHVPAGDVVCVPLRAMMYDETNFANAMEFNGFRFVSEDGASNTSKLTDGDTRFPLWGLGRRAWWVLWSYKLFFVGQAGFLLAGSWLRVFSIHSPGRYFAVDVLKMVIAHILQNYDLKMADLHVSKKRTFDWRSATIPQASATLFFRERGESKKLKR